MTMMRRASIAVAGFGVLLAGCAAPAVAPPATDPAPRQGSVEAAGAVAAPRPGPGTPPPGMTVEDGFTLADIVFLQQMIPHHELALRMAGMAITRASSPGIKAFARQLTSDSGEVQQLRGWLLSLGIDPGSGASGHHHGGGPTARDLDNLASLSGAAFDSSFLDLTMRHSLGAIELARAQVKHGNNARARRLAAQIATREPDRIATLERIR